MLVTLQTRFMAPSDCHINNTVFAYIGTYIYYLIKFDLNAPNKLRNGETRNTEIKLHCIKVIKWFIIQKIYITKKS